MDEKYHIKLTDFGSGRILAPIEQQQAAKSQEESGKSDEKPVRRRNSFVGTAQFVAPEILQGKEPSIGSDLWGLGCIIYQMLTGKHLFTGK